MQSSRTLGLFVGLALGVVWMWLGFGAAVLAGFLGLLGWFIGAIAASAAAGRVNLADLWDDVLGRGRATP